MVRLLAFVALIVAVGWWTAEAESPWHRPGASPTELTAALSECRAEATCGLQGLIPGEGHPLERCMTELGWAQDARSEQQVASLR